MAFQETNKNIIGYILKEDWQRFIDGSTHFPSFFTEGQVKIIFGKTYKDKACKAIFSISLTE